MSKLIASLLAAAFLAVVCASPAHAATACGQIVSADASTFWHGASVSNYACLTTGGGQPNARGITRVNNSSTRFHWFRVEVYLVDVTTGRQVGARTCWMTVGTAWVGCGLNAGVGHDGHRYYARSRSCYDVMDDGADARCTAYSVTPVLWNP